MPRRTGTQTWGAFLVLWLKFCGVTDEFRVLVHRWSYAYRNGQREFSVLPDRKQCNRTFQRLSALIAKLEGDFRDVGFRRTVEDNRKQFGLAVNTLEHPEMLAKFAKITLGLDELSKYVGGLKTAFLQRTASDEISQSITGYPRSPESTMGNELMYMASDTLGRAYESCLRFSSGVQWDGVLSFQYFTSENYIGAVNVSTERLKLFHVTIAEESKYFPGTYVSLAHEMAHGAMFSPIDRTRLRGWVLDFCRKFMRVFRDDLSIDRTSLRDRFEECMADLLGVEIAGPSILFLLNDMDPSYESLFRTAFVRSYYGDDWRWAGELRDEVGRQMYLLSGQRSSKLESTLDKAQRCGRVIARTNASFLQRVKRTSGDLAPEALVLVYGLDASALRRRNPSPISLVVRDRFDPANEDIERVRSLLRERIPIYDEDPRLLIHTYYETFRKTNRPASYATLIQSLAFNQWNRD